MALASVSLDDKYAFETGRIYLTGTQALARLILTQRRRDAAAGLNTAGYVSGYRGSPLGGLDRELWRIGALLDEHRIRFQPGVNEDLAATALWGSQQAGLFPGARHDGVFGLWYGKGPGVDRSGDVFRHANLAGTAPHGGVLVVAGDDPASKASTAPSQSEYALIDAGCRSWFRPVFATCSISASWLGAVALFGMLGGPEDGGRHHRRLRVHRPRRRRAGDHPARRLPAAAGRSPHPPGHDWPPTIQDQRLHRHKLPAARAFARANGLDRVVMDGPTRRIGIVAAGKTFLDVLQALDDLGVDHAMAASIGLCVYKVGMVWPLDTESAQGFAGDLEEILVIEEKRPVLEPQFKEMLYHRPANRRARVVGKTEETGAPLVPPAGELTPAIIARAIARRLDRFDRSGRVGERLALLGADRERRARRRRRRTPPSALPYFCSGCPTTPRPWCPTAAATPAGIGCHYMAPGWTARPTPSPRWAARAPTGSAWRRSPRPAPVRQHRRRHLFPFRHPGDPRRRRVRRQHHLQDPLQRRRRHDRRPAPRGRADGAADRRPGGSRRGEEGRHRHRRAGQVSPARGTSRRASPSITATTSTRCSATCARSPASRC